MSTSKQQRRFENTVLDNLSASDIEDFFNIYIDPEAEEYAVVQEINQESFPDYCPE